MGVFFSFSLFIRLIRIHLYAYKEYRLWVDDRNELNAFCFWLSLALFFCIEFGNHILALVLSAEELAIYGICLSVALHTMLYGMVWPGRMPYDCCWVKAVGLVQHRVLSCNYTRMCVLKNGASASAGTDVLHFLVLICDGKRNQWTEHVECRTQRI